MLLLLLLLLIRDRDRDDDDGDLMFTIVSCNYGFDSVVRWTSLTVKVKVFRQNSSRFHSAVLIFHYN